MVKQLKIYDYTNMNSQLAIIAINALNTITKLHKIVIHTVVSHL